MRRFVTALVVSLSAPFVVAPAQADIGPPRIAKPAWTLDGNRVVLNEGFVVEFDAGTARLTQRGLRAVLKYAEYLKDKTWVTTARIEGHVAAVGDGDVGNAQQLSEARALAVVDAMVKPGGIECERLLPVGFGTTKPVADNSTPAGRAQNTRIEVHNAALRGKAIGGMPLDGGGRVAGDPCRNRE